MARDYTVRPSSFGLMQSGPRPVPIGGADTFDVIEGDGGNNVMNGTSGVDTINGYGGNDVLNGLGGDDNLFGGDGTDTLVGDIGADTMYGGADADSLQGGNDVDFLYGGGGDDSLRGVGTAVLLTMSGPSDVIDGGNGIDLLVVNYAGFSGGGGAVGCTLDISTGSGEVDVNGFRAENFTNIERLDFSGPEGADVVTGGDFNDSISGWGGNDILKAGDGDDAVRDAMRNPTDLLDADGGDGFDGFTLQVFSSSSNVVIDGNEGTVTVNGAARGTFTNFENLSVFIDATGNNTVTGVSGGSCYFIAGGGNNIFVGQNQGDVLQGHGGHDSLFGGGGDDSMDAWIGTNTLDGGGGNDTMYHRGGTDTISAGGGDDLVVVYFMASAETSSFDGGTGDDELQLHLTGATVTDLDLSGASITGFEALTDYGLAFSDHTLTMTTQQLSQFAHIELNRYSDRVTIELADNGDFTLPDWAAFAGLQLADGGQVVDFRGVGSYNLPTVYGGDGNDTVFAPGEWIDEDIYLEAHLGGGNDRYTGTFDGGDTVDGGDGKDRITTGKNHDNLTGGLGADTLDGGKGSDDFIYNDVAESTGTKFDTIENFDANFDEVIVPFAFAGVNDAVEGGTLSKATFNDDLKAAIGRQQLDIEHFVIFTPDAGDYAGETFVVIEANDKKGYQANADYVILLEDANLEFASGLDIFT